MKRSNMKKDTHKGRNSKVSARSRNFESSVSAGKVFLVGAGPGDPGLITLRGLEILRKAEAVVYDALVNPALVRISNASVKIDAGKRHTEKSLSQKDINALIVRLAKQGKSVARLKGGDPFVFGRGGEELEALRKAKIDFEVVPGVSAGHAVPAYAGIPVTDRRFASQVTYVTGHEDPNKPESSMNWKNLAENKGTLVFFMGIQNLKLVCKKLAAEGMSARKPAAIIQWGSLQKQKVIEGNLGNISQKAIRAGIEPPALTVIGDVVRFRKKFSWFKPQAAKLSGKSVVVTRPRLQSSTLTALLEQQGAEVLEFPSIEILPPKSWAGLDRAIQNLNGFDWVLFTSVNGVQSFMERLKKAGKDTRAFARLKIGAIGEATQAMLEKSGIVADFVPERFTSESMVKEMAARFELAGARLLLPRADIAPEKFCEELGQKGASVVQVEAYRTVPGAQERHKKTLRQWMERKKMDFITFTSSSTVRNFFESFSNGLRGQLKKSRVKMVSIGPVTTETLKEYGFKPWREAREHTVNGLMEAMLHD